MNKENVIKEMMLNIPQKIVAYDGNPAGQHLYGEQRQQIAEVLYEAGYRKVSKDSICKTIENSVDTPKRKYESIDDIARGFIVKDGKLMYVTNILDGYRHEFKDIYEICDELNLMMKQLDSLTELTDYLKAMNKEIRDNTAKEILSQLAKWEYRETTLKEDIEELAEKWHIEVTQ